MKWGAERLQFLRAPPHLNALQCAANGALLEALACLSERCSCCDHFSTSLPAQASFQLGQSLLLPLQRAQRVSYQRAKRLRAKSGGRPSVGMVHRGMETELGLRNRRELMHKAGGVPFSRLCVLCKHISTAGRLQASGETMCKRCPGRMR